MTVTNWRWNDNGQFSAGPSSFTMGSTTSNQFQLASQATVYIQALGEIDGNGHRPNLGSPSDTISWNRGTAAGSCPDDSPPAENPPAENPPQQDPPDDNNNNNNNNNNNGGSNGGGGSGSSGGSSGSSGGSSGSSNSGGGNGSDPSGNGGLRLGAIGVLYRIEDGPETAIHVYGVDENSQGHFLLRVSQSEINNAVAGLVKSTEDGRVAVIVEENNNISFAMGPSPSGKVHYASLQEDLNGSVVSTFTTRTDAPPGLVDAPPTTPSPPTASSFNIHIVQRGENLYQIARRYGVSMDQIVVDNRLADGGQRLHSGQELQIHNATRDEAPRYIAPVLVQPANEDGSLLHTVESGHTLSDIALAYGMTVDDIVALNELDDGGRLIFPGQQLVLAPVGTFSVDLVRQDAPQVSFVSHLNVSTAVGVADASAETAADAVTHVVRPGERLYRIALRYGVAMADIIAHNQLTNGGRLIFPGQQLVIIPAEETLPANLVRHDAPQVSATEPSDSVLAIAVADEIAGNPLLNDDDLWLSSDQERVFPAETLSVNLVRRSTTLTSFSKRQNGGTAAGVADTSAGNELPHDHDGDLWRSSDQQLVLASAEAPPAENASLYVDRGGITLSLSPIVASQLDDVADAVVAKASASQPSLLHNSHQLFHGKEEFDLALDRYIGLPELSPAPVVATHLSAPVALDFADTAATAPVEADPPAAMHLN